MAIERPEVTEREMRFVVKTVTQTDWALMTRRERLAAYDAEMRRREA